VHDQIAHGEHGRTRSLGGLLIQHRHPPGQDDSQDLVDERDRHAHERHRRAEERVPLRLFQHHVQTEADRQPERRRDRGEHEAGYGGRRVARGQQLRAVAEVERGTRLNAVRERDSNGHELRRHREQREDAGDANDENLGHPPSPGAGPGTGTKLSERRCHGITALLRVKRAGKQKSGQAQKDLPAEG
jgi:hypothetical protein